MGTILMWVFLMFVSIVFIFAVILTGGATSYLQSGGLASEEEALFEIWGSVAKSMFSLWMGACGVESYKELARPLMFNDAFLAAIFFVYIFVTVFSVMNIITGVFVDFAMQQAASDRELMIQRHFKTERLIVSQIHDLFKIADADGNGVMTKDEMGKALLRDDIKAQ